MKTRLAMKRKALSIAVLLCAPLIVRCGSDSDGGGTSGGSGKTEPGAGDGGLADSGRAGTGHAGIAGESTSGGTDAAGSGGVNAGSGGVNAGSGGVNAGSGGVNAGSGGVNAGSGGVNAGSGGVGAGSGGVAGTGPGILNVSTASLLMMGSCTAPPQTFIISNSGQSTLTWTAALSLPYIVVTPASSTLPPATGITVSVSTATPVSFVPAAGIVITINSDVAGQTPATVSVQYSVTGTPIGVQPDLDVGEVRVGQSKLVFVPAPPHSVELALGSNNSEFSVQDILVHGNDHWTLRFAPSALGPRSATLSIIVPFGPGAPACPSPNLFTAHGVGIAP